MKIKLPEDRRVWYMVGQLAKTEQRGKRLFTPSYMQPMYLTEGEAWAGTMKRYGMTIGQLKAGGMHVARMKLRPHDGFVPDGTAIDLSEGKPVFARKSSSVLDGMTRQIQGELF